MFQRIKKLSLLFLGVALFGLVSATMHYHSDTILCIEHASTPHYTNNDQFCPVSVLNLDIESTSPLISGIFLSSEEPVIIFPEGDFSSDIQPSDFGRAPPFIA